MSTPIVSHAGGGFPSWLQYLPLCGQKAAANTRRFLLLAWLVYLGYNAFTYQTDYVYWDYLLLTGMFALWLGLIFIVKLDADFHQCIERLFTRQVLSTPLPLGNTLEQRINQHADKLARIFALICTTAMILGFIISNVLDPRLNKALLTIPVAAASYLSGCLLGRLVSHGKLAKYLKLENITVSIFPDHVDGVGGLKPIGDFFFSQAMVASIPVLFLGIWVVLIPYWPGQDYSDWSITYLGLLILALIIMLLAFVVPMVGHLHGVALVLTSNVLRTIHNRLSRIFRIPS